MGGGGGFSNAPGLHLAGTTLRYKPGVVTGSSSLVHDCGTARGIGYFLEPLVVISLFGRKVTPPPLFCPQAPLHARAHAQTVASRLLCCYCHSAARMRRSRGVKEPRVSADVA